MDPLEFVFDEFLPRLFGLGFACEHGFLLLEPFFVVALVGVANAVVEFENPIGDIAEEVAVVRDDDEGAFEGF